MLDYLIKGFNRNYQIDEIDLEYMNNVNKNKVNEDKFKKKKFPDLVKMELFLYCISIVNKYL